MRKRAVLLGLALAGLGSAVQASCEVQAAEHHSVAVQVLQAVMRVESTSPVRSVVQEPDGTFDVGAGRVGRFSVAALSSAGVVPSGANSACLLAYVTAWHLGRQVQRYGNTWWALGAFSSEATYYNNRYQALLFNELVRMGAMQGPLKSVPSIRPSESPDAPGVDELVVHQVLITDGVSGQR